MTSQGDERAAVAAMKLGALDYVVKSEMTLADMPRLAERALREWGHIVERRLAEAARLASEARLAGILDLFPHAVISVDEDSRITLFNQGAEVIFGHTTEEIMGKPLGLLLPPPFRDVHARMIRDFAEAPDTACLIADVMGREREVVGLRKDGTEFPAEAAITRLRLNGEVTLTVGLRDVTEQRAKEEALRQSQKMEVVGQLAGGLAHDLNNIMTVVLGSLSLALDDIGDDDSQIEEEIRHALGAADRAVSLVERLLAFSRKRVLNTGVVNMNQLMDGMLDILVRTLPPSIQVRTNKASELWPCEADFGQLENALLNLVINARDAMPGDGVLTIETVNAECLDEQTPHGDPVAPGDYVCLVVRDTGTGMSPKVLEQVFLPFFTTKGTGKGSGLGMSMIHGFVTQSGGHVWIDSVAGEGTAVSVRLPRLKVDPGVAGQ